MKKRLFKKSMALILSAVLTVGLLPVSAFAAGGSAWQIEKEGGKTAYHTLSDSGESTAVGTEPAVSNGSTDQPVTVKKTIAGTGTENKFQIALNVSTSQRIEETVSSPDAAVVLVFDLSGSMNYCSENGESCKEHRIYYCDDDSGNTYEKGTNSTCVHCHERRFEHKEEDACISRLTAAKEAAIDFLNTYAKDPAGAKRMVSIVTFAGSGAMVSQDWIDVADDANLESLVGEKGKINSMTADGGTPADHGLQAAEVQFGEDGVKTITNRFTLFLTDGEPTRNTGWLDETVYPYPENYEQQYWPNYDNVARRAYKLQKDYGSKFYSVCFGVDEIFTWMSSFSDLCKNAANAKELDLAFVEIINLMKLTVDAWKVTDPMGGQFIGWDDHEGTHAPGSVAVDQNTLTWDLRADLPNAKITDKDGKTVSYETYQKHPDATYTITYTLNYNIQLDTAAQGFEEEKFYLTNGYATLAYFLQKTENGVSYYVNEKGEKIAVDAGKNPMLDLAFRVPAVQGTVPKGTFSIELYKLNDRTADRDKPENYELDDTRTYNDQKLWTTASVEAKLPGYEKIYADGNYELVTNSALSTTVTDIPANNVMRLYYAPIKTAATVTVHVKTDAYDAEGNFTAGEYKETGANVDAQNYQFKTTISGLYVGDSYAYDAGLAPDVYSEDRTQTPFIDEINKLSATAADNQIELWYTGTIDKRDAAALEVYHVYTDEIWTLNEATGRYEEDAVTGEPVLKQSVTAHHTEVVDVSKTAGVLDGYEFTKYTQKGLLEHSADEDAVHAKLDGSVKDGNGNPVPNTVTLSYTKPRKAAPGDELAITLTHHYTKNVTVIENGKPITYTNANEDVEQNIEGYYAGETLNLEDYLLARPDEGVAETYRLLDGQTMEYTLTADGLALTLNYDLVSAPEKLPLAVEHVYRLHETVPTYEEVPLFEEQPVFEEVEKTVTNEDGTETTTTERVQTGTEQVQVGTEKVPTGTEVVTTEKTVPAPDSTTYYVGEEVSVSTAPTKGYETYTFHRADTEEITNNYPHTMLNGENEITLFFDLDADNRGVGSVTVNHRYTLHTETVVAGVPKTLTTTAVYTTPLDGGESPDYLEGKVGDAFIPAAREVHGEGDGAITYDRLFTDEALATVYLSEGSQEITLEYEQTVSDRTEATLTVNYHYATNEMQVVDGKAMWQSGDELVYTQNLDATYSPEGVRYINEDIALEDKAAFGGNGDYVLVKGRLDHTIAGESDTVNLYYVREQPLPQAEVTVTHRYTLTTIDALGQESQSVETVGPAALGTFYVGTTQKAEAELKGYDFASFIGMPEGGVWTEDEGHNVSFAVPEGKTDLVFAYTDVKDNSKPATYTVNYFYKDVNWDENPDDVAYPALPNESSVVGGYYATQRISGTLTLKSGYTFDDVTSTDEHAAVIDRGDSYTCQIELVEGGENTINFYAYRGVDTRVETTATVKYVYNVYDSFTDTTKTEYTSSDSLWTKEQGAWLGNSFAVGAAQDGGFVVNPVFDRSSLEIPVGEGDEAGVQTLSYDFTAVDPASGAVVLAEETAGNVVTITYTRDEATTAYTVVHRYLYDGEERGVVTDPSVSAKVGDVVLAAELAAKTVYQGVTYGAPDASVEELTLSADAAQNVITLTYAYTTPTVEPPEEPEPEEPERPDRPDRDPKPDPEPEPEPEIDIEEPEVPLGPAPEPPAQPDAALPPEIEGDFVIVDEAIPLGSLPQTGSTAHAGGLASLSLMAAAAAAGLAGIFIRKKEDAE